MTQWTPTVDNCDRYLDGRSGCYEYRKVRYSAALEWMVASGLSNDHAIIDVGAGRQEFLRCAREDFGFAGKYIPVDGAVDGTNINFWTPERRTEWFVAMEILEHLTECESVVRRMQSYATMGIAVSTPNPRTTDVLGMDETHVVALIPDDLKKHGFSVGEETFYGGVFSNGEPDSLFATWRKNA